MYLINFVAVKCTVQVAKLRHGITPVNPIFSANPTITFTYIHTNGKLMTTYKNISKQMTVSNIKGVNREG